MPLVHALVNDWVWTRNALRDAKLVKYFFMNMKNKSMISGVIKEYDSEDMLLKINMNGVTKEVPMKIKEK